MKAKRSPSQPALGSSVTSKRTGQPISAEASRPPHPVRRSRHFSAQAAGRHGLASPVEANRRRQNTGHCPLDVGRDSRRGLVHVQDTVSAHQNLRQMDEMRLPQRPRHLLRCPSGDILPQRGARRQHRRARARLPPPAPARRRRPISARTRRPTRPGTRTIGDLRSLGRRESTEGSRERDDRSPIGCPDDPWAPNVGTAARPGFARAARPTRGLAASTDGRRR